MIDVKSGLFPSPMEIHYTCTCPDDADLCKHVGAALYGVGVRFDADPQLFFYLRGVDPKDLFAKATQDLKDEIKKELAKQEDLSDLFGIDLML